MMIFRKIKSGGEQINFGLLNDSGEYREVQTMRVRVYIKEGYYPESVRSDLDQYDVNPLYFAAQTGEGKIIGSARVIRGKNGQKFPIENAFSFAWPPEMQKIPRNKIIEIGKLVSEKPENSKIGKTVVAFGLIDAIIRYSQREDIRFGFFFIKKRLLESMRKAKIPFYELKNAELIYPREGVLADYFYQHLDPVIPVYGKKDEMASAVRAVLRKLKVAEYFKFLGIRSK